MSTLEELKAQADALGIKYMQNIGAEKLAKKIEDFNNSQTADDSYEVQAPVVKRSAPMNKRQRIAESKKKAMAKRIVVISSNDKRDSEFTTTAYLGFENAYFGISKIVPLDMPVELEQALIDVAKETVITLHKDEVINGRRTGNKVPVKTRKYNVSYEDRA